MANPVETQKRANPSEGQPRIIDYGRDVDNLESWQSGSFVGNTQSTAVKEHVVNLPNAAPGLEFTIAAVAASPGMSVYPASGSGDGFILRDTSVLITESTSISVHRALVRLVCHESGTWTIEGGFGAVGFQSAATIAYMNGASYIKKGTVASTFWLPKNADGDDATTIGGFNPSNGRIIGLEARVGADNSLVTGVMAKTRFAHGRAFSGGHHGYEIGTITPYGSCQGEEFHLKAFTDGDTLPSAQLSDYADTAQFYIEPERVYLIEMRLIGKRLDKRGEFGIWNVEFGIDGRTSPGSLIIFQNETVLHKSADAENWDYTIATAAGLGGGVVNVTVTGDTAMKVGWSAVFRSVEVFGYKAPA